MRISTNLVLQLLKIPKSQPKYFCQIDIRRPYHSVNKDKIRCYQKRYSCCCKVTVPPLAEIRKIHVTEPKRGLHPILLLFLRPLTKLITILSGRLIRKWWKKLSPEDKKVILHKIRKRQSVIAAFGGFTIVVFALYYFSHLVETPLTKRKRFIMINDEAVTKLGGMVLCAELGKHKKDIVPESHPFFLRARRVCDSILNANKDIPELHKKNWSLTVIDRPDIINAFSTADGTILIFTGVLNVCTNDDQLAIVMSHEISHAFLSHTSEAMSKMCLVEALLLIPSFICWIVFTDIWAFMSDRMMAKLADLLISLPFSRTLEQEADMVGILLAARACFDVREALVFWSKMAVIESSYSPVNWLSTHPTSDTRKEYILNIIPNALELRSQMNCPRLRNYDSGRRYSW